MTSSLYIYITDIQIYVCMFIYIEYIDVAIHTFKDMPQPQGFWNCGQRNLARCHWHAQRAPGAVSLEELRQFRIAQQLGNELGFS